MAPTKQAEMLPYQETCKGKISLIVRTCHLKSAVRMSMEYAINGPNFVNHCGDVKITKCYYDGKPWPSNPEVGLDDLVATEEVVENLALALAYFATVRTELRENNEVPSNFEEFLKKVV